MVNISGLDDLINKLKKQDQLAQEWLFKKYRKYLLTICRIFLDDDMVCEEVRSEAFFKIFLKIKKADIPNEKALLGWMKKITINEALHFIRRKKGFKMDKDLSTCDEESITIMDPDLDYSEIPILINSLPETHRTVLCLHVIDGYSHNEIADKLCISISVSRSLLYHARLNLRNTINKKEKNTYEYFR